MTNTQIVVTAFVVLIGGLLLPLPHGARMALVLALVALAVMTLLGGGVQYVIDLVQ